MSSNIKQRDWNWNKIKGPPSSIPLPAFSWAVAIYDHIQDRPKLLKTTSTIPTIISHRFQKVYDILIINPSQFRRHFFSGFAAPHPLVWSTSRNNLRPILRKRRCHSRSGRRWSLRRQWTYGTGSWARSKFRRCIHSLKRTASLLLKNRPKHPKRKRESLPTIHLSGAFAVRFREGIYF